MSLRFLQRLVLSGAAIFAVSFDPALSNIAGAAIGVQFSIAWTPIDNFAAKLFAQADTDHDGLLSRGEFRAAQSQLRSAMPSLVRRGAVAGIPAAALNAQASGPMLPGQQQISKPEFTLYARSLAIRMANQGPNLGVASLGPRGPARGPNGYARSNANQQATGRKHHKHGDAKPPKPAPSALS